MRYEIWRNCKLVSECQKEVTVIGRLLKMKYRDGIDKIWVVDTTTWLSKDYKEYIPV